MKANAFMPPASETFPRHPAEATYLTGVLLSARIAFHGVQQYAAPTPMITMDALNAWITTYRPSLTICYGDHGGRLWDAPCVHNDDLRTIDTFIRLLQSGLANDELTSYLTAADIEAVSAARQRIAACQHVLARKG